MLKIIPGIIKFCIILTLSSCNTGNYHYDPTKGQEFIPIERMTYKNKDEGKVFQYILVKNAPTSQDARKEMMLTYAKKEIAELDSVYTQYSLSFFRYGPETAEYLTNEYRKDWVGERYVLYSGEPWNDTQFKLGWFYSWQSEADSTLWDIKIDVVRQEFPIEQAPRSDRTIIMKNVSHIKELNQLKKD